MWIVNLLTVSCCCYQLSLRYLERAQVSLFPRLSFLTLQLHTPRRDATRAEFAFKQTEAVSFKNTIAVKAGKTQGNLFQEQASPDLPCSLSPHHYWAKQAHEGSSSLENFQLAPANSIMSKQDQETVKTWGWENYCISPPRWVCWWFSIQIGLFAIDHHCWATVPTWLQTCSYEQDLKAPISIYTQMHMALFVGTSGGNWIQTQSWQTDLYAVYENTPSSRESSKPRAVAWNSSKSHFREKKWDQEVGSDSDSKSHSLPSACCNR